MAIVINGSGTVTGLAVGGLPDGTVDAGTLATDSVDSAEIVDGSVDRSKLNTSIADSGNATAITIDSSENVGIGVVPEAWHTDVTALQVGDKGALFGYASDNYLAQNTYNDAGGWKYLSTATALAYKQSTSGTHEFRVAPSGTADATISWTTAMTIDNSGEVGINRTTGAEKFGVKGDTDASATVIQIGTDGYRGIEFHNASDGTCGHIVLNTSSVAYNTSSDYRLKENVVDMENATDRVKQLKPKRFNFIADDSVTVDGFIAHEVSSVVPEAISGEKDAVDDDGNAVHQGIDQSKLVPLLVKTIQELEARITALEA